MNVTESLAAQANLSPLCLSSSTRDLPNHARPPLRILSEENDGQWGFTSPGPYHSDRFRIFHVNSDDTAYVIRMLRQLGANRTPECLMPFYREAERLFVTWNAPGPRR